MSTTRQGIALGKALGTTAWFCVFLLFLLKIVSGRDLSWWWVTSPLWGLIGLGLTLRFLGVVFSGIATLLETKEQKAARLLVESLEDIGRHLRG